MKWNRHISRVWLFMKRFKIMKVLTITTSYANNYGALLQCYALSYYLNTQEGIECEVIQYYRPNYKRSWTVFRQARNFKEFIKLSYMMLNIPMCIRRIKKNKLMRQFQRDYIPFTQQAYYTVNSIYEKPPQADVYICGSDQIWNMKYVFEGKGIYFLDFVPDGKRRVAYAPSIADSWKEEHIERLTPLLSKFDAISIREKGNLVQLQNIYPNATVTIDPVFLLGKEYWKKIARTLLCPKEPYIFCYFLSVSELGVKTVKKLHQLTGYKVVHLNLNALDKFQSDYHIRVASPLDFVGLISKASLVCTNSFHCSAFSIIYHKNFCFIPKGMANERVVNLQDTFKLGNVFMSEERLVILKKEDIVIDYSVGEQSGKDFISYSKDFLMKAIYGEKN